MLRKAQAHRRVDESDDELITGKDVVPEPAWRQTIEKLKRRALAARMYVSLFRSIWKEQWQKQKNP